MQDVASFRASRRTAYAAGGGDVAPRLVALARAQAPLRRTLAAIAGRLVAARGWERLGYARRRDYAAERAGVSDRHLQELAQVDAVLARLPRLQAAFLGGELTWTQARLLGRVATPEDEARWITFARQRTARALAREVRAVDRCAAEASPSDPDDPEAERREAVKVACDGRVRSKWLRTRWLARRVAGERLPTWAYMESVAAEVLSAIPLDGAVGSEAAAPYGSAGESAADHAAGRKPGSTPANGCAPHGVGKGAPEAPPAAIETAGLPAFLQKLIAGLDQADSFELDARLRRAVRLEQRLEAEMGPLLLEVARGRLHRELGFPNLDRFANEALGMAPRKAQALLRLERAGAVCPPLRAAYREGRLSWVQAHVLVPLLMLEPVFPWRETWVDHAQRVSVRRLEDDVDRAIATDDLDPDAHAASSDSRDPQTGASPMGSEEQSRADADAGPGRCCSGRCGAGEALRRTERQSETGASCAHRQGSKGKAQEAQGPLASAAGVPDTPP